MNIFLNQLLNPELCITELDDSLMQYMCTQAFIDTLIIVKQPETQLQPEPEPAVIESVSAPLAPSAPHEWFTPKQDNTLFWCIFISVYGYSEYWNIGSKYVNAELEEKLQIIDTLQTRPTKLKEGNYRITNQATSELLSELMVSKRNHLFSLVAFSIHYQKNIYIIFENNTYLRFSPTKDDSYMNYPSIGIKCRVNGRNNIYSLLMTNNVKSVIEHNLPLEHYTRPLRGISSYNMQELWNIVKILKLEVDVHCKKAELYEKIASVCSLESVIRNST